MSQLAGCEVSDWVWCWQVCQELERQAGRAKLAEAHGSVDLEYLKNIMLKLYETGKFVMLREVLAEVCVIVWLLYTACRCSTALISRSLLYRVATLRNFANDIFARFND